LFSPLYWMFASFHSSEVVFFFFLCLSGDDSHRSTAFFSFKPKTGPPPEQALPFPGFSPGTLKRAWIHYLLASSLQTVSVWNPLLWFPGKGSYRQRTSFSPPPIQDLIPDFAGTVRFLVPHLKKLLSFSAFRFILMRLTRAQCVLFLDRTAEPPPFLSPIRPL